MPSPTQGIVKTNTANQTAQIKENILNRIIMTLPMDTPLFTLLYGAAYSKKLSTMPHFSTAPKFKVFEMDPMPDEATVSGQHAADDTTITVDDASPFIARDTLQVEENGGGSVGEIFRVSSVNTSTNVITVEARGAANSTAAIIQNNATIKKIGSAIGEGGIATKGVLIPRPSTYTGCVQYFAEEIGATAHRLSEEAYYGDEWVIWEKDMAQRWKKSIELACLCNNLADYTSTSAAGSATDADYGNLTFFCDGIHGRVSTNRFSLPNATYRQFCKKMGEAIKANQSATDINWVGLVPLDTWDMICGWGEDKLRVVERDDTYGFVPTFLRVPGVNRNSLLPLFYCPIMDQTMFNKGMVCLSMGSSSGVRHMQLGYLKEKQGPRKGLSWDFVTKSQGTDVNPKELTARVLRRIECIVGPQINVETKHVVFDELAT
jgi:hypothetical protein